MRYERPVFLVALFLLSVGLVRLTAFWLAPVHGARFDRLESTPCWFDVPKDRTAFCGYFTVPDHRDRALTVYSRLAVAIFTPPGGATRPDPVLFLSGGPGGAFGFNAGRGWWWTWIDAVALSHGREFIAMDQRGVGRSEPRVDCPALRALEGRLLQREILPEEEDKLWLEAVATCHQRLLDRGVDLSVFGSGQSAADVDDLRRALGYKQWNLYGISYGTRLALSEARDFPAGVRTMVLDSVYPPEADTLVEGPKGLDLALRLFWSACGECDGMNEVLERVIERLNRQPVRVHFVHPDSLESFEVVLDGDRLIDALVVGVSGHSDVRRIADAVAGLDEGETHAAAELVRDFWNASQDEDFSYPVNFSVECRDEIPFNDEREAIARAEQFPMVARHEQRDNEISLDICKIWGVTPEPRENEPVRSPLPTLILSGAFDPVTPMPWAERTLQYLPNAHLLKFMAGHSVTDADPCALKLIAAFLDDPGKLPTADCYPRSDVSHFVRP